MKNIYYYLTGLAVMLTFTVSCNDAIDITQPSELLSENAFRNVEDLENGIFGVYSAINTSSEISFSAIFTDEVSIGASNGGQGLTNDALHTYTLNPNTGAALSIWSGNYTLINRANRLLDAAENIVPDATNQLEVDSYNHVLAQAYALRAFAHSNLLYYFSEDITNNSSLSVIALDFVPGTFDKLPRNTVGEVITLIENDLNTADGLFDSTAQNNFRFFVDEDFTTAVRARLYTNTQNYGQAEVYADNLISTYALADQNQYVDLWEDELFTSNVESIFSLNLTDNNGGISSVFNTNSSDSDGAPIYEMSREVFNILRLSPTDARLFFVDDPSEADPNYQTSIDPRSTDIIVINKYPGDVTLASVLINDIKVFRVSEMYLIKAEARVDDGDLNGAATQIQLLRSARLGSLQPLASYANDEEAYQAILEERRIELFVEGHRYLDVKRLGERANKGYERDPIDCSVANLSVCDLSYTDYRTQYLPIPRAELLANTNMSQNPNY